MQGPGQNSVTMTGSIFDIAPAKPGGHKSRYHQMWPGMEASSAKNLELDPSALPRNAPSTA